MNTPRTPESPDLPEYDGVRDYDLFCVTALFLMLVSLVLLHLGSWALLPVGLGGLALWRRWRTGPVLVLLSLVVLFVTRSRQLDPLFLALRSVELLIFWVSGATPGIGARTAYPPSPFPLTPPSLLAEGFLTVGTLAYCAGAFRLLGVRAGLLPPPSRKELKESPKMLKRTRRPVVQVTFREIATLLMTVLIFAGLAEAFWRWLRQQSTDLNIRDSSWQGMLVVWLVGGGILVVTALVRVLAHRRLSRDEAVLYLQDVAWRETRGEQRRLQRWLTWARLRARRKGET